MALASSSPTLAVLAASAASAAAGGVGVAGAPVLLVFIVFAAQGYHVEIDSVNCDFIYIIRKIDMPSVQTMSAAPSPAIDSSQLATFLAVAESGGVLPASRRLNVTQPAVTARIQQLEETLATPLFLRSPRGMTLTARGRRLLDYARRSASLLGEAAAAVGAPEAAPAAPLTLAASTTPASHVLPELFARYRAASVSSGAADPLAGLTLRVANTAHVLAWVRAGTAPLALVEGQPTAAGLHLEMFLHDELLPAYAPAAFPKELLARIGKLKRPVEFARLGIPLLWREEGSGTRRVVENALDRLGAPARVWSEGIQIGGGVDTMKAAALAGLGVAFISGCAIKNEIASGALRVLPAKTLRISRAFRWAMPGTGLSGAAAAFKRFADREARKG